MPSRAAGSAARCSRAPQPQPTSAVAGLLVRDWRVASGVGLPHAAGEPHAEVSTPSRSGDALSTSREPRPFNPPRRTNNPPPPLRRRHQERGVHASYVSRCRRGSATMGRYPPSAAASIGRGGQCSVRAEPSQLRFGRGSLASPFVLVKLRVRPTPASGNKAAAATSQANRLRE